MGRRAVVMVGVALLLGAGVGAAGAAPTDAGPSAEAMVIAAADVPGATVTSQKATRGSSLIAGEYERALRFAKPYGSSKYEVFVNLAILARAADIAMATYTVAAHAYTSAQGRKELIALFAGTAKGVTISRVATRPIALGGQGLELTFVAHQMPGSVNVSIVLFRLDRVVEIASAEGAGPVGRQADLLALGKLITARARSALMPGVVAPPAITGTDQQGQLLAASTGTWTNPPTAYAYQWQRCDAAGGSCLDVPGATTATYALTPADVGDTLRVDVTATDAVGSGTAVSAVTAPVT